ncbi:MAG TPA: hypothetical protein VIG37_10315 [Methylomirabilota bacterium]|jgi:hypothetical protein
MERVERKGFGQRWVEARPTKTLVFWSWVGCVALTMLVGFTWGGWVRGATALSMAETEAQDAVTEHLAMICVAQADHDPAREQRLNELKALGAYEQGDYVKKQGWARMPGDKDADSGVADECARRLAS